MSESLSLPPVLGPFSVGEVLGGNGQVITATAVHKADPLQVILTAIPSEDVESAIRQRFIEEAQGLLGRLFAHVLPPHLWGEERKWLWCAWRRLPGDHTGRLMRTAGIPPVAITLELARQVAVGLQEIHDVGLSHGGLSPASVFMDNESNVWLLHVPWVRVLEGLEGRYLHPAWMSVLPFTAPEIAAGGSPSPQGDAYSLGSLLYFLLMGRPMHWADEPESLLQIMQTQPANLQPLANTIKPSVVELLEELLSIAPEDRPVNWPALIQRFEACTAEVEDDTESRPFTAEELAAAGVSPPEAEPEEVIDSRFGAAGDLSPIKSPTEAKSGARGSQAPPPAAREEVKTAWTGGRKMPSPSGRSRTAAPPASARRPKPSEEPPPSEAAEAAPSTRQEAGAGRPGAPGRRPRVAPAPSPAPSPPYVPGAVTSSGVSKQTLLLIVLSVLALVAVGVTAFLLYRQSSSPASSAGGGGAPRAGPTTSGPKDPAYTQTANAILSFGRLVQWYQKLNRRYPSTFQELPSTAGKPIDAWGTSLDLREGFIVSAGKDKKWDTRDDIYFDPHSGRIGGYIDLIDLPESALAPTGSEASPGAKK